MIHFNDFERFDRNVYFFLLFCVWKFFELMRLLLLFSFKTFLFSHYFYPWKTQVTVCFAQYNALLCWWQYRRWCLEMNEKISIKVCFFTSIPLCVMFKLPTQRGKDVEMKISWMVYSKGVLGKLSPSKNSSLYVEKSTLRKLRVVSQMKSQN